MPRGRIADIRYRVIPVADPVAGATATFANPGQFTMVVRSVVARLVTDATVATRHVVLTADDGSDVWFRSAGATQAATLTRDYDAHEGASVLSTNIGNHVVLGLPAGGLVLDRGNRLIINVESIQAGDQLSGIVLHALELETGWVAAALPVVPLFIPEFDPTYVG